MFGPLVAVLTAAFLRCGEAECLGVDHALFCCLRRVGLQATAAAYRCAQLSGERDPILSDILTEHDPEELAPHLVALDVGSSGEVQALLSSAFADDGSDFFSDVDSFDALDFGDEEYDS
jgi:hypothetical protein